jgi:LEA14-like dessication related protein
MKKIFTIILIVVIIINVIAGAFLFIDIQILKAPVIHIDIEPIELTQDTVTIEARATITNPNSFDVSIGNFNVVSTTKDGYEIGRFLIEGGTVSPQESKTFIARDKLGFNGHDYTVIKNTITADIGISVLGVIKKTIPFEMTIDASLADIINKITVPILHLQANVDEVTRDGLHFSGIIDAYNPNDFEIFIENLSLLMKTEKNVNVGNFTIDGGILEPAASLTINASGTLLFKALDAESIRVNLSGIAGAKIAGITKTLPLSLDIEVAIPDIATLLSLDTSIDFLVSGSFKIRLRGILCNIEFAMYNPSNIPLDLRNLVCYFSRLDGDKTQLLGMQNMNPCTVEPKNEECLSTQIIIPYSKFLFSGTGRILPDWFIIHINLNITISGVNQTLPISIIGYLSPHFLFERAPMPEFPFIID